MRIFLFLFLLLGQIHLKAQEIHGNSSLKIILMAGDEPLRGATVRIKGQEEEITYTDMNGLAEISKQPEKTIVEFSILGPYVALKLEYPADSIHFDVNSKNATFFYKGEKIRKRKQKMKGY